MGPIAIGVSKKHPILYFYIYIIYIFLFLHVLYIYVSLADRISGFEKTSKLINI